MSTMVAPPAPPDALVFYTLGAMAAAAMWIILSRSAIQWWLP